MLGLGRAAPWRSGVSWKSERGLRRSVRTHLRPLFPTVLTQSAFHRRLRRLGGGGILIQDAVAEQLAQSIGKSNGLFHRRRAPALSPTPRHRKPPPSRAPVREAREAASRAPPACAAR